MWHYALDERGGGMSDFELKHPENISAAAPKFADAGADLAEALTQLQSVLAGCKNMCGDDEQGRKFAEGYNPAAETVEKSLTFSSTAVKKLGTAVKTMGDNYQELEDKGTKAARTNGAG